MMETEAEVVRDLAYLAARPSVLEPGKFYAWPRADGSLVVQDLRDHAPAWKSGTVVVEDVAAFACYYAKHADDYSEVFADTDAAKVTAVLDAHCAGDEGSARWQQHRLVLELQTTTAWDTWLDRDRKYLPQDEFAQFLEDNYRDIAPADLQPRDKEGRPVIDPAGLLEIAQKFEASVSTEFAAGTRLASGETELVFKEAITPSGGKKMTVPTVFDLVIAPYEDCDADAKVITARFRYRIRDGKLTLGYFLNNPERHEQDAVRAVVAKVAGVTGATVMYGRPTAL